MSTISQRQGWPLLCATLVLLGVCYGSPDALAQQSTATATESTWGDEEEQLEDELAESDAESRSSEPDRGTASGAACPAPCLPPD